MAAAASTLHPSPFTLHASTGTVLGFDFGEKRIGVAVGDLGLHLAHPLTTVHAQGSVRQLAAVEALVKEWNPVLLVVGLPSHPDGAEHEMSRAARRFAARLQSSFGIEAVLVDERYTSASAEEALRAAGARRRKAALDPVAAQHILQAFFDERAA